MSVTCYGIPASNCMMSRTFGAISRISINVLPHCSRATVYASSAIFDSLSRISSLFCVVTGSTSSFRHLYGHGRRYLITVISLISNIANSTKEAQPAAFNFIHDVFPRVSSPVILFFSFASRSLSPFPPSFCYLSCFLSPNFFLSIFSLVVSPVPIPVQSQPPSLSLFHFSIVKGKIMYLSAAFLLPSLLYAATCWLYLLWNRRRRSLGSFSLVLRRNTSRALQTLPENYAPVAWYVCSRLWHVNNKNDVITFLYLKQNTILSYLKLLTTLLIWEKNSLDLFYAYKMLIYIF